MRTIYTAIFTDKKTGKVIYRLDHKAFDPEKWPGYTKYAWEKAKALKIEDLAKELFLSKTDIQISEHVSTQ